MSEESNRIMGSEESGESAESEGFKGSEGSRVESREEMGKGTPAPGLKRNGRPTGLRIGLVENDPRYCRFLVAELKASGRFQEPILTWPSAEQFLRDEQRHELDLLLLDIDLSGISGVQLSGILSVKQPDLTVIILSNLTSDEAIVEAIKNGVNGYLLKSELENLMNAIDIVLGGGAMITPTIALRVMASFRQERSPAPEITDRERQILELMVEGKTIASVAEFLLLSPHTVHHHVKSIYKKLEVHNRAELVRKVQELSLM
ncbi:MAG: DNA-binding response regulator [Leptospiraceae bacterium]